MEWSAVECGKGGILKLDEGAKKMQKERRNVLRKETGPK